MPDPIRLHVATLCYGGVAHANYIASLLAFQEACSKRSIALEIDLRGGEALFSRGRAAIMAKFIAGQASHLLFIDADLGFTPDDVFRLLGADLDVVGAINGDEARKRPEIESAARGAQPRVGFETVQSVDAGFLLIKRAAAEKITAAYPELLAGFGDMPSAGVTKAVMVFDAMIDPATQQYLNDGQAFCHRWRALGGEVWAGA